MRPRVDFSYQISDERLLAWARKPLIERLQMLDEMRRFTLAVRAAPVTNRGLNAGTAQNPEPGKAR